MKKVLNFIQWLSFAALVVFVVWISTRPAPAIDYAPATWSNWDGFMVISYAGVTRDDNAVYPSSQTLKAHLKALKDEGYNTIAPSDALAFLERRAPLPEKALLILFEGARKETVIRAYPILQRLAMQATLCVPTESLESWDESRMKGRDIHKLSGMPQWNLAAMGHEAVNPITVSDTDVTDHFLSTRKWLPKKKRVENDDEFRMRIEEDYRISSTVLETLNGSRVLAYVYPFADDGRRPGADPLAAPLNFGCVTSRYSMAFVSALNPYNPPGSAPFSLSRLRVNGDWSAAQVVSQLKHAAPLGRAVTDVDGADRWVFLNTARVSGGALHLAPEDAAWVKGSDLWQDVDISAELSLEPGATVVCYARFLRQADCVRLSIGDQGVRLQELRAGGPPVTIATAPPPTGQVVRLIWRLKGLRSWVSLDGVSGFGPVPLAEPRLSGRVGFESRSAGVKVSSLTVKYLPRLGLMAESWAAIPVAQRGEATDYLPHFPSPGEDVPVRQSLDFIQAASEGASVWPILSGLAGGAVTEAQVDGLTRMLARKDLRPFVKGFVLEASQTGCAEALRARGFGVMHRMKAGDAMPLAATNRSDCVWIEGSGTGVVSIVREFLHRHPPSQMVVRDRAVLDLFPGIGIIGNQDGDAL